jgi:nitrite reductase/ring-hydroxylating ferredoxin subunit
MAEFEPVLRTPELGPGEKRAVTAHGQPVVVANVEQTYYAVENRCPNEGTALATEGRLHGYLIICPRDDWAFDIRTGLRIEPPGGPALRRFPVKVEGNTLKLGPAADTAA